MITIPGSEYYNSPTAFKLVSGQSISTITLAYETHGRLNRNRDNAILVHHALSPSHHIAAHSTNPERGWWQDMVGPGAAIDTNKFYVICINNLGSCFGSTGPSSINPNTGETYKNDFPVITIRDISNSQCLLASELGIDKFYAVIGNSMGAMISLQMAIDQPRLIERLVLTSSAYKAYPANIINRSIQMRMMAFDLHAFNEGQPSATLKGFHLARELGHLTYRNPHHLNAKFKSDCKELDKLSDIEKYFEYNANKFTTHFDPYAYIRLLQAMDTFDVTERGSNIAALKKLTTKTLVISVDSDLLFTPEQQIDLFHQLEDANIDVQLIRHHSSYGHDAFLVETDQFTNYIGAFISA